MDIGGQLQNEKQLRDYFMLVFLQKVGYVLMQIVEVAKVEIIICCLW